MKATLYRYPTLKELDSYIPEFVALTWLENVSQLGDFMKERGLQRRDIVDEMFARRTLPTAMETIHLTFLLEGLDLTNVTHIIRHRMFSFSAQSSDPTSMEGHDILMNDAWEEHTDLRARAMELCIEANNLYKDALDRGMTFYDARHFQPRAKEAKYFMSGSLNHWIAFLNTRLGRQNQPTSDNILAARIRAEIIKVYPQVARWIHPQSVQHHYVGAMEHKFNLNTFPPDELHSMACHEKGIDVDNIEFNHPIPRDQYTCNQPFEELFQEITEDD